MSSTLAQWIFPPTGGGMEQGFIHSGNEHFRHNPIGNLVRESIQNSLDAHDLGLPPVVVRIQQCTVPRSDIGADQLKGHLQQALKRAKMKGQTDGTQAYNHSLELIDLPNIPSLLISDENTTGLRNDNWHSLIREEGVPNKGDAHSQGVAGGSFGIGKNASFVVSGLHTVIYSTLYTDLRRGRIEKMTGRAQLVSHQNPKGDDLLQHVGFYSAIWGGGGKQRTNSEPLTGPNIPKTFRLSNSGTGLWVLGFQPESANWKSVALSAVAENFFHAILNRNLKVYISAVGEEPEEVSCDTLDIILERVATRSGPSSLPRYYCNAIRQDSIHSTKPQGKVGAFDVYLDCSPGAPKNVAYINRKGMLITNDRDKKSNPFHPWGSGSWPDFVAVVIAKDDATDQLIRQMENPSHDSISVNRLNEPECSEIKNILADVNKEIGETIKSKIFEQEAGETDNLRELAELFPELDPSMAGNRQLKIREIIPLLPRHHAVTVDEPEEHQEEHLDDEGESVVNGDGNLLDHDDDKPNNGGEHRPEPGPVDDKQKVDQRTSIISRARIVRSGKSELTVGLTIQQRSGTTFAFTIRPAGDEYRREKRIPINSVSAVHAPDVDLDLNGNLIRVSNFTVGQQISLVVDIGDDAPYLAYSISEHQVAV